MNALLVILVAWTQPACEVVVLNPDGLDVRVMRVDLDRSDEVRKLGQGKRHELRLPHGAYWLAGQSGDAIVTRVGLPLHRRAAGSKKVTVTVRKPPPPTPGWCWIPGGPALIGDVLGVGQEDERPAQIVDVAAFWMGRDEVTNAQYAAFLNAQPKLDRDWLNLDSRKIAITRKGEFWAATRPNEPVITVSWHGARAYCRWLTLKTGLEHRLPTEREWEKAARGPESFTYAYGNVYTRALANQESGALEQVGRYRPNAYGLRDLTGNAFEWVGTVYDRDETSARYVLRGGSFVLDGMYLRNSFRMYHRPTVRADDFGFRVVRPANTKSKRK